MVRYIFTFFIMESVSKSVQSQLSRILSFTFDAEIVQSDGQAAGRIRVSVAFTSHHRRPETNVAHGARRGL